MTSKKTILFDIEGNGLLPELHTVHCICLATPTGPVRRYHNDETIGRDGTIEDALVILQEADELYAHNSIGYDVPALKKLYPTWAPKGLVKDTLVYSRLLWSDMKERDIRRKYEGFPTKLWGRHSLESWGLRLGVAKGSYADGWETFSQRMLDYCDQDVVVLQALYAACKRRQLAVTADTLEHDYARVINTMNNRGVRFDVAQSEKVQQRLEEREAEVEDQLRFLFTDFTDMIPVPFGLGPAWIIPTLKSIGWIPGEFTKTSAPRLTNRIIEGIDHRIAQLILKARTLKKQGADYFAIQEILEEKCPPVFKAKRVAFNPGSRNHLARALKEKHGWKPTEFGNDGKPKMDEAVLDSLSYPEVPLIRESLMLDKRLGQLTRGRTAWQGLVKDGFIYPYVNHLGTIYSRDTHSKPNITQVVKPSNPWGKEFRELWKPREGYILVGLDLKGIDLRVLGHYLAPFDGGKYKRALAAGDPHTYTQKLVGLKERDTAKTLIYALLYGAYEGKVAAIVGCSMKKAKAIREGILGGLGIEALIDAASERAKQNGGWLKGLDGRQIPIRRKAVTLNYLIAAGSAVVSKRWCVDFDTATADYDSHLIIRAHDEMQTEVRPKDVEDIKRIGLETALGAGEALGLRVPTPADANDGDSWATTH